MAAIQKIRGMAGLLVGALGVALLAFILGDFFNSGNTFFNKAQDRAFVVDGEVISTGEYQKRSTQWEEFVKINNRINSLTSAQNMQVREMVYEQMVKERMLDDQAEKLGLSVTAEELREIVYGNEIVPMLSNMGIYVFHDEQTGQFDKARLIQLLEFVTMDPSKLSEQEKAGQVAQKEIWTFIENRIKYQRLEEKYASLVAGSLLTNEVELKNYAQDSKNNADVAYVVNKYTNMSDSAVSVSDQEIKALYDKRKNNFKLETPQRKISYFVKDIVPSEDDFKAVENEIEKAHKDMLVAQNPAEVVNQYSENQYFDSFMPVSALPISAKEFVESQSVGAIYGPAREGQGFLMYKIVDKTIAPDSIKLQIIALPPSLALTASNSIIDSLHTVVKNGKEFTAVADELMPGSNGGAMPQVSELDLASRFGIAKECFAANAGDILKLTIQGQPTLVKIVEKNKPTAKAKLAIIEMPVIVSEKTQNTVDNELSRFISENGNAANFEKGALEKGYALVPNATINPFDFTIGQEADSRTVIHWAFNEKVGTVKKFDLTNKRIVAILNKEIEDKYQPLDEVKDRLKAELVRDKKSDKMIADMKAKNLTSLDAYAQSLTSKVDTVKFINFQTGFIPSVGGNEPVLNVIAALGELNKLSAPMKGNAGVYVLSVINKTPSPVEFNSAQAKLFLRRSNFNQVARQSMVALKEKMGIEDNRVKFW